MANLKKCDRCGAIFEIGEGRTIKINKETCFSEYYIPIKTIDLCDECTKKLVEWVDPYKDGAI